MSADESTVAKDVGVRPGPNYSAWLGPIVVFFGCVSYFLFFVRFPTLRDFPWVNLPLVGVGVLLSLVGLSQAFGKERGLLSRLFATIAFVFSMGLGALFVAYIFHMSYEMPSTDNVLNVAAAAPSFSVQNQDGELVQLADYTGKKLVVSFYRGFW